MAEDRKFRFDTELGQFVNRVSGEPIPDDEPVMLFRARDKYALAIMRHYRLLSTDEHHRRAVQDRIDEFTQFSCEHEDRMKEPGITHHVVLNKDAKLSARRDSE